MDAGRIGTDVVGWGGAAPGRNDSLQWGFFDGEARPVSGRFPANLALECTCEEVEVIDAPVCGDIPNGRVAGSKGIFGDYSQSQPFEAYRGKTIRHTDSNCPAYQLDAQAGDTEVGYRSNPSQPDASDSSTYGMSGVRGERGYKDTGGPSRFFYCAKASRGEREEGLSGFEPQRRAGLAGADREGPLDDVSERWRTSPAKNHHPTVKPIDLNKWLASLLLPPDSVKSRRLLVPFSGSGSEMIGALLAGWDEVVGIEQNPEYAEIARARIAHWASGGADARPAQLVVRRAESDLQPSLF